MTLSWLILRRTRSILRSEHAEVLRITIGKCTFAGLRSPMKGFTERDEGKNGQVRHLVAIRLHTRRGESVSLKGLRGLKGLKGLRRLERMAV